MKRVLFLMIFTSIVLFSCTNEKIQLISNYEQQVSENVKMDLKFKCKSFEKISDVYSVDSVKYYQDLIVEATKWSADSISEKSTQFYVLKYQINQKIDSNQKEIDKLQSKVDYYNDNEKYDEVLKLLETELNIHKESNKFISKLYEFVNYTDVDDLVMIIAPYNQYKDMPNTLLCTKYKCVYTIFNPIAGVKQEVTKTYYISPKNKIIKTEV